MITLYIYGLDQFVVGRLSRELTPGLCKLYETGEENVNFVAPDNMVFHNGVEQTSWNAIIRVHAPNVTKVVQEQVAEYLMSQVKVYTINVTVLFDYYSPEDRYESISDEYPRFITEDNVVDLENPYEGEEEYMDEEDEECEECGDGEQLHHHHHHDEDEEEVYTGDIFAEFFRER